MKRILPIVFVVLASCKPDPVKLTLHQASKRYKVPIHIVFAVAKVESNFNQKAISNKGAIGIMQVMPLHQKRCGCDITRLRCNVHCGVSYLRDQYQRNYSISDALARYNAGWDGEQTQAGKEYARLVLKTSKEFI